MQGDESLGTSYTLGMVELDQPKLWLAQHPDFLMGSTGGRGGWREG